MNSDFVLEQFRGVVSVGWVYCFCSIGERLTQGFWVAGVSGCFFRVPPFFFSSFSFFFPLSSLGVGSGLFLFSLALARRIWWSTQAGPA